VTTGWRRTATLLILIGLATAPGRGAAQWPAEVSAGARVQVRLPELQFQESARRGQLIRGRIAGLSSDTLYLAVTDSVGPLPLPRSLIERLELSRGVPSRGASALRRGLISGALSAAMLALYSSIDGEADGINTGEAALIGGGVGLAAGAIFGALFPRERWKSVRILPPQDQR
jgi:hypothetical protein